MANRAKIFPFNRWSDTTLGTISSSGAAGSFVAANTQKRQRGRVWRSSSLTSPYLYRDLGANYRIGGLLLVSHNMTVSGQFRVRISANAAVTDVLYDTGWIFGWETLFGVDEEPDGADSEFVGVDGAPLAGTLSFLPKPVRRVVLADDPYYSEVNARYIQIDFDDLTNADGYIEVAYVYAGIVVELEKSMAYGWQLWRQEQARTKRAANGQIWVDSLYKRFHASCLFDFQSDKRAGGFWKYFFNHVGVSKEFGVSLKDGTAASKAWTTLYCKLAQPVPVGWVDYDSHEVPVEFVEIP